MRDALSGRWGTWVAPAQPSPSAIRSNFPPRSVVCASPWQKLIWHGPDPRVSKYMTGSVLPPFPTTRLASVLLVSL